MDRNKKPLINTGVAGVNRSRRALLQAGGIGAAMIGMPSIASMAMAQGVYPAKPLTLIVPYPPGGNTDMVARMFSIPLGEALGQPVVVDNRGGAGGLVGMPLAAKARPDGYTMVIGDLGSLVINRYAHADLPYSPPKDFVPVSTTATVSVLVTGRADLPVSTFQEFLQLAKANPGKFRCGTSGVGSIGHLSLEMLKTMAGIDVVSVPYRGGGPALTDLLGGHIDLVIDGATFAQAKAGKIKALAVTGDRVAAMPDVPTIAEAGVPGFHFSNFWGYLMPAGTPAEIVDKVSDEMQRIALQPNVRQQLEQGGITAKGCTSKEFADLISASYKQVGQIVKDSKISFTS